MVEQIKKSENIQKICAVSAKELQNSTLPEQNVIVENMLYEGLSVFAGPPKIGKSWFSLQLGISVSTGTDFLGFKTVKGRVLYLALEDSYRRLQNRLNIMLNNEKAPERFLIFN